MTDLNIKGLHHDHIDGSLAVLDVLDRLHALAPKGVQKRTPEELRAYLHDAHENIVERFGAVTSLLQTKEALYTMGYAYGRRRAKEGYEYVEAKFAPQYHAKCEWNKFRDFCELTLDDAIRAMTDGLWDAETDFRIRIFPQLCLGREADADFGVRLAKIALDHDGEAGFDLVCDEAGHPPEKHLRAYRLLHGSKVPTDCHAAEWVARQPSGTYAARLHANLRTAICDLKVRGIGHAITLANDAELTARVIGEGIRISMCPLSNKTLGCIADVRDLRIDELLDKGVILTLNPDDDLFLPPMTDVARECDAAYRFTSAQKRALEHNVFRGAFAADIGS